MVTFEFIKQNLEKAEREYEGAKEVLNKFTEGWEGQRLKELLLGDIDRHREEFNYLTKKEEGLKGKMDSWEYELKEWNKKSREFNEEK
ncbi:8500_t:CDS:1, partial [Diversispora eburnea]